MWKKSNQSISSGDDSININAGGDVNLCLFGNVPTGLVDDKIGEELRNLRRSRFFIDFDRTRSSLTLALRITEGDLSGGSAQLRARALAWSCRLLVHSENSERAEEFLRLAKTLGDLPEIGIAEAFIISQKGDQATALRSLATIDSHATHSAGLMIVRHHRGVEGALRWMDDAGYTARDLDSDGKSVLLRDQLQLGRWNDAENTAVELSEIDFDETPILHRLVALTALVASVPQEFRSSILTQVPYQARDFPLAADAVAINVRREAHKHFLHAVNAANQYGCHRSARADDEYALWLELRDPEHRLHGKSRLENKLRDPSSALGFVHYALQFGIKVDLRAVERDIDHSIAINGGMTSDAAIARFALAFAQPTPEEAANYIARHHNQLTAHIDTKLMRYRQIEMLSRADLIERANEVLSGLLNEGIPAEHESNLRRIIAEAQGGDSVESRKAQYESTGSLGALIDLVTELEDHHRWDELCDFGKCLFNETRSLRDAERLVAAFNHMHRSEALVAFLTENGDLLSLSPYLRMSYAWGLYHEGSLLEARAALAGIGDQAEAPNYRALQLNLAIATGDWASLSTYVAAEYQNRNNRSAQDLIGAAQLALNLSLPHAKELVFEAAAKADSDASVLASAYFIATRAGWENDKQVFRWLERAAELSGDNGPIHRANLKDVLDRKPEWDRRESETWRLVGRGQLPLFLAAQSLNRTLTDLITLPALANLRESDPRRRSAIPAFSGKRVPIELNGSGKMAAFDATSLLTLSFLNILDVGLDAFETVYIPHSTLWWLFEERQKAAFHQPSRISNARSIASLLAADVLAKFTASTVASSDLASQVGDDLAALIAEAEKARDDDVSQHIVVRPAPVHRISSLMEEEADLSKHSPVLSSCLAVVEKLRQKGTITSDEERRARTYLQLHERPWQNQPEIADGATLYLDDLALTYFLHLGLLEKLNGAGLKAVACPTSVSETRALLSYGRLSEEVDVIIERIRASLSSRIECGHIRVGRRPSFDDFDERSIPEHPTVSILALASHCDLFFIDDRFLNQHLNIDNGAARAPIFSSLELMRALLSQDDSLEKHTRLRRAGYFFVPIGVEELHKCLRESEVAKEEVIETAELKAIRESVLRVRMSDWLRLPAEAPWLDGTLKAFVRVLKNLWKDDAHTEGVIARSNWLVEQIDVRGWAHSLAPESADNIVRSGRAAHLLLLLSPPAGVEKSVVDAYWNWAEERVLAPVREQFPEVYEWLIDWYRNHIQEMAEAQFSAVDYS